MLKPKYPILFLFIALFSCFQNSLKAQNFITDWSIEAYESCPTQLLFDQFLPTWISMRGNPDYFNACSPNLGPLTNPFGYQEPRTGDATVGVVTFSPGLANAREYPGVELIEPLVIGEEYELSFFVSTSYSQDPTASRRVTNNLGILLLTNPWLDMNELGTIPNFAHINMDAQVTDTTNWIQISGVIVADSAYRYAAFGNFFDDDQTNVSLFDGGGEGSLAYYFFDDFCVVPLGGDCTQALSAYELNSKRHLCHIYPNPVQNRFNIKSESPFTNLQLYNSMGVLCYFEEFEDQTIGADVKLPYLNHGIYLAIIETEQGYFRQRLAINP